MKNKIEWNDNISKRIYLKSVEKILRYNDKKVKNFKLISTAAVGFAVIIMVISLFFSPINITKRTTVIEAKNTTAISEFEENFTAYYKEFFTFSEE